MQWKDGIFMLLIHFSGLAVLWGQMPKPPSLSPMQQHAPTGKLGVSISTMMEDAWLFDGKIVLLKTALQVDPNSQPIEYVKLTEIDESFLEEEAALDRTFPLLHFDAKPFSDGIAIVWDVPASKSTEEYQVHRRKEGQSWELIEQASPNTRARSVTSYEVIDDRATFGLYRYRLGQARAGKPMHHSPEIWVDRFLAGSLVAYLHPDPYLMGVSFAFELNRKENISCVIHKTDGTQVGVLSTDQASAGKHQLELDLSRLEKGFYVCDITIGTHRRTIPLIQE